MFGKLPLVLGRFLIETLIPIQVIDNKTKNDITYQTQLQLLADQERKALNAKDVELLKRVIRSDDGTFTGYIKALEAKSGLEIAAPKTEEFKPFMATELNASVETPATLN